MSINTTYEYVQQKKALLKQCLNLSEELLSSIDEWDPVSEIVEKREVLILQLKELEKAASPKVKAALTKEMKQEMDQMIRLILDLDQEATGRIKKGQQDLLEAMKQNVKGQKLIQYAQAPDLESGRKMDYKK